MAETTRASVAANPAETPRSRYITAPAAAVYLGVSASTFRAKIRPQLPMHDFGTPGRPIPRYAITDLDAWAASRRREKKTA